jgi:transposase
LELAAFQIPGHDFAADERTQRRRVADLTAQLHTGGGSVQVVSVQGKPPAPKNNPAASPGTSSEQAGPQPAPGTPVAGAPAAAAAASDAKLLADLVRTDRHNHRRIAGDSGQAQAIKVLARAHQNLIWARTRHTNALRSALREYYPAALEAFEDLADRDALAILGRAPTPADAGRLSLWKIRAALKAAGRQRNLDTRALQIQEMLRCSVNSGTTRIATPLPSVARTTPEHHR